MKDEKLEQLLADFMANTASEADKENLEKALEKEQVQATELADIKSFWLKMEQLPEPAPSASLRSNFYQMLAEEKHKQKATNRWQQLATNFFKNIGAEVSLGKLAYSCIVLSLGVALGFWFNREQRQEVEKLATLTSEMQQMKKMMMLTLLKQPAATDRLKAVNLTSDFKKADNKVINALLQTLNQDPDVNVRLAAIEALYQHANDPVAREGLVLAITKQDSPLVQLALADVMVAMQEKESVQQLKKLLKKEDLNEAVKQKVEQSIQVLI
ncbi:HEAT repeat domain-containing protein [Adhaeribacter aquaticus]|uniref:HEAT repeat domain-containing protein n=1 Tax=Adhaeribacter aquaticus TaxID=299567 RepID=UPI00040F31E0|nr:HEAT repeat domain-containing protein [Adhaeribacter aquaticus]